MKMPIGWAAVALALATPASAQVAATAPSGADTATFSSGALSDPGGLSFGSSGSSGASSVGTAGSASAGTAGVITNPGGLDFTRSAGTGGGAPSAGIATSSTGVQPADDQYLYPLYGKSFR